MSGRACSPRWVASLRVPVAHCLNLGTSDSMGSTEQGWHSDVSRPRQWLPQSSPRREPWDCHVPCVDGDVSPSRGKKPELRPALKGAGEADAIVAGTAGSGTYCGFVDMFQNQWSLLCCRPARTAPARRWLDARSGQGHGAVPPSSGPVPPSQGPSACLPAGPTLEPRASIWPAGDPRTSQTCRRGASPADELCLGPDGIHCTDTGGREDTTQGTSNDTTFMGPGRHRAGFGSADGGVRSRGSPANVTRLTWGTGTGQARLGTSPTRSRPLCAHRPRGDVHSQACSGHSTVFLGTELEVAPPEPFGRGLWLAGPLLPWSMTSASSSKSALLADPHPRTLPGHGPCSRCPRHALRAHVTLVFTSKLCRTHTGQGSKGPSL